MGVLFPMSASLKLPWWIKYGPGALALEDEYECSVEEKQECK